jgi:nucleoside-diphosphate-sugar epimerase
MNILDNITVLGADGWIGSNLVQNLRENKRNVIPIGRANFQSWISDNSRTGTVIYSIGLTSDFRYRPFSTVEAHVNLLCKVLKRPGINRLVYLSSTRVYSRSSESHETSPISCLSSDPSDLYNLSKMLGEALVLQDFRSEFKVIRLSNVVGLGQPVDTFIGSILKEVHEKKFVSIEQSRNTIKNYIALKDAVKLIPLIAEYGNHRIYNLGSNQDTSHWEIASLLENQGITVKFNYKETSEYFINFPSLSVNRLSSEFEVPINPFDSHLFNDLISFN